jgi:hypothetical protein
MSPNFSDFADGHCELKAGSLQVDWVAPDASRTILNKRVRASNFANRIL